MSGGGSSALDSLLEVPGASKTVLAGYVPYSQAATVEFLGHEPERFCDPYTARLFAMSAFTRARNFSEKSKNPPGNDLDSCRNLLGIGCTASLASDRAKKGDHRIHIALQGFDRTIVYSLKLTKRARTREEEERLAGMLILTAIAENTGIEHDFKLELFPGEQIELHKCIPPGELVRLLFGDVSAVLVRSGKVEHARATEKIDAPFSDDKMPLRPEAEFTKFIFSGSFRPLHRGHCKIIDYAENRFREPVALEIAIRNTEKPMLDFIEIEERLKQIDSMRPNQAVWLTAMTRFENKSVFFRGATFLLGADTFQRVGDPDYNGVTYKALLDTLRSIARKDCRFLVFARRDESGEIRTVDNLKIPDILRSISEEVPASEFLDDSASREIRKKGEG